MIKGNNVLNANVYRLPPATLGPLLTVLLIVA
jgi:hypothetical protein